MAGRRTSRNNSYSSGVNPSGFFRAEVVAENGEYISAKIPKLGLDNIYDRIPVVGEVPDVSDSVWVSFIEGQAGHMLAFSGASEGSSTVTISDTPPLDAEAGDLWFESDTTNFYIFYDDVWVEIGGASVGNIIDMSDDPPDTPAHGDLWFNPSQGILYIWDDDLDMWTPIVASARAAGTQGQVQYNLNGALAGATGLQYDYYSGDVSVGGDLAVAGSLTVGDNDISVDGHTHSYLPLTGGTLTGSLSVQGGNAVLNLRNSTATSRPYMSFYYDGTRAGYIGYPSAASGGSTYLNADSNSLVLSGTEVQVTSALQVDGTLNGLTFAGEGVPPSGDQIVRSGSNGYTYLGWLNTVSGETTGTPTRIYTNSGGSDSFVRYMTPANFRAKVTDGSYATSSHTHSYLPLTGGTLTSDLVVNTRVRTNTVTNRTGQQLVLNAGESEGKPIGAQTGELVYVNAEGGLRITTPSVSNWGSGYADRITTITGTGITVNGTAVSLSGHTHSYSPTNHAHSYLPLSGGTITGTLKFKYGSTTVGDIKGQDTTWLRINQETNKNIYTPRYIRADNGLYVDGTDYGVDGGGNIKANYLYTFKKGMYFNRGSWTNEIGFYWNGSNAYISIDNDNGLFYIGGASDSRVKDNVETMTDGLDYVRQLRPVRYNPIPVGTSTVEPPFGPVEDGEDREGAADYLVSKSWVREASEGTVSTDLFAGLIAQEVRDTLDTDNIVEGEETDTSLLSVTYQLLVPYLISALQTLDERQQDILQRLDSKP
jgi:hypothetical protein